MSFFWQPGNVLNTQSNGNYAENIEVPHFDSRAPGVNDVNYPIGKWWIWPNNGLWYLIGLQSFPNGTLPQLQGNWVQITNGSGDVIEILGTANQITATTNSSIVTLSIPNTFIAPGSITAENGDITAINGNINLTNSSSASGVINFNGTRFISNFGSFTNTFVGSSSANSSVTGSNNCALGILALNNAQNASNCVAIGSRSLSLLQNGFANICIGYQSGVAYTSNETANIIIGDGNTAVEGESGVTRIGTNSTLQTYIRGIANVTVSNTQSVVINSSTGQLGVTGLGNISSVTVPKLDAISLTTATPTEIASFTITKTGVYLFSFIGGFTSSSVTTSGALVFSVNKSIANGTLGVNSIEGYQDSTAFGFSDYFLTLPSYLLSCDVGDIIYLVAQSTFSAGSISGYGTLFLFQIS